MSLRGPTKEEVMEDIRKAREDVRVFKLNSITGADKFYDQILILCGKIELDIKNHQNYINSYNAMLFIRTELLSAGNLFIETQAAGKYPTLKALLDKRKSEEQDELTKYDENKNDQSLPEEFEIQKASDSSTKEIFASILPGGISRESTHHFTSKNAIQFMKDLDEKVIIEKIKEWSNKSDFKIDAQLPPNGETLLFYAANNKLTSLATFLLEKKANPDQISQNGATPLAIAAQNGHTNIVSILMDRGADPNKVLSNGLTPLSIAVNNNQLETVETMLIQGANPNAVNNNPERKVSFTPIFNAVDQNNIDMTKLLLKYGADPKLRASDSKTPLEIANSKTFTAISELLTNFKPEKLGKNHETNKPEQLIKNRENYQENLSNDPSFSNIKTNLLEFIRDALLYQRSKPGKEEHRSKSITELLQLRTQIIEAQDESQLRKSLENVKERKAKQFSLLDGITSHGRKEYYSSILARDQMYRLILAAKEKLQPSFDKGDKKGVSQGATTLRRS